MSFRDDLMHKVAEIKDAAYYKWLDESIPSGGGAPAPSPEEGQAFLDGMGDLEGSFEYFASGDPDSADQMIAVLGQAKTSLTDGAMMDLGPTATYLQGWNGDSASMFRDRFFTPFHAIATNHANLIEVTSTALRGYQEILRHARQDIMGLADGTLAALRNEGNSGDFLVTIVGLAAAVTGAAITIASAGVGTPAAGAAAFGLLSTVSGAAPKVTQSTISGKSTKEVLDHLRAEIKQQSDRLNTELNALAGRIDGDLGVTEETTMVGGDDRYTIEKFCVPSITSAAVSDGVPDGKVQEFTPPNGW